MRKCECGGKYKILGIDEDYGDSIEIECIKCGDTDTVEPDGLGMGGMEWVQAQMITAERKDKEAQESKIVACSTDNLEATLTGSNLISDSNETLRSIDGIPLDLGDVVLVKQQSNARDNGIYEVASLGSEDSPYILTRVETREDAGQLSLLEEA